MAPLWRGEADGELFGGVLLVGVGEGEGVPGEWRALVEGQRIDAEERRAVDVGDGQAQGQRGGGAGAVCDREGGGEEAFAVDIEARGDVVGLILGEAIPKT